MARFRYSMQSVLDIKEKMETQAKQEFSAAKTALDAEEEILQQYINRKTAYETAARNMQQDGANLDLREIKGNRAAISCMEEKINTQQVRVSAAENHMEQARVRLTEVMIERKTHEKLKEKAFQIFMEEEKRLESKTVDELTSYTYGQKDKKQDRSSVMT